MYVSVSTIATGLSIDNVYLYQDILTPPSNFTISSTGFSWTLPQFLIPPPVNSDIIYGWPLAMSKKMPSSQLHIYRKCTRRQSQSWVSNGYHFRPFNCQKIGFPAMPNGHCVKRTTVGCFIYILDSSNSNSITFWTSQFGSSSRSN